jgi:hypothetical protein
MRKNALFLAALLVALIAAPVVDAIACDDCKDIIPFQNISKDMEKNADHSRCLVSSADGCDSDSHGTSTAQDLCPVCYNISAAMVNECFGIPTMVSDTNHLPKLLAFSDPSYSITKPPER